MFVFRYQKISPDYIILYFSIVNAAVVPAGNQKQLIPAENMRISPPLLNCGRRGGEFMLLRLRKWLFVRTDGDRGEGRRSEGRL